MSRHPTIERALELARAGEFDSVNAISQQLKREGFENVHTHLGEQSLTRQLAELVRGLRLADADG